MPKNLKLQNVHVERMSEGSRAVGWEIDEYRYHYWTMGIEQTPEARAITGGTIYRNPINPICGRTQRTARLSADAKDNARMVAQVLNELGQAAWLQADVLYAEKLQREQDEQHALMAESIKHERGPALYDAVSLILQEMDGAVRAMRIGGDLIISGQSSALHHLRKVHKEITTAITDDLVSRK